MSGRLRIKTSGPSFPRPRAPVQSHNAAVLGLSLCHPCQQQMLGFSSQDKYLCPHSTDGPSESHSSSLVVGWPLLMCLIPPWLLWSGTERPGQARSPGQAKHYGKHQQPPMGQTPQGVFRRHLDPWGLCLPSAWACAETIAPRDGDWVLVPSASSVTCWRNFSWSIDNR